MILARGRRKSSSSTRVNYERKGYRGMCVNKGGTLAHKISERKTEI